MIRKSELPKHYKQIGDIVEFNKPVGVRDILDAYNEVIEKYPDAYDFCLQVSTDVFNTLGKPSTFAGVPITAIDGDNYRFKMNYFSLNYSYKKEITVHEAIESRIEAHVLEETPWWMFWKKYK
jgi:hypothetical protein